MHRRSRVVFSYRFLHLNIMYLITCSPMFLPQIQQETANLEKSKMQHDISELENNIHEVSTFFFNQASLYSRIG